MFFEGIKNEASQELHDIGVVSLHPLSVLAFALFPAGPANPCFSKVSRTESVRNLMRACVNDFRPLLSKVSGAKSARNLMA